MTATHCDGALTGSDFAVYLSEFPHHCGMAQVLDDAGHHRLEVEQAVRCVKQQHAVVVKLLHVQRNRFPGQQVYGDGVG